MTENPPDPWTSLADELGVQAQREAPPAAPPDQEPSSRASDRPAHSPASQPAAPPKKPPADWQALAGALGIEMPPEATAPVARKDPVAELFGFPPSTARTREEIDEENRQRLERRAEYRDDVDELAEWESSVDRGDVEKRYDSQS